MQCFNCGNDADMEVFMMINGKMKKMSICMECYREQTQTMMEEMQDENGNIDPEKIQKRMFDFFQNNKEEFDKLLGEALEDVDMSDIDLSNVDIANMNYDNSGFNLSDTNLEEIFNHMNGMRQDKFVNKDRQRYNPFKNFDTKEANESLNPNDSYTQRQIRILQRSVQKKRDELMHLLEKEDYMAAASSRDEIREMNKKIMIIKRLEKEGEK